MGVLVDQEYVLEVIPLATDKALFTRMEPVVKGNDDSFCLALVRLHLECSVLSCSRESERPKRTQKKGINMGMRLEYMIYTHIYTCIYT